MMRISVANYAVEPGIGARQHSLKVERFVREARIDGADIIVFPEYLGLELIQGRFEQRGSAEQMADYYDDYLRLYRDLSRRYGLAIVAGTTAEPLGRHYYNTLHLFLPGSEPITYRKIHLHRMDVEMGFRAGGEATVATVGGVRLGFMVCYDLGFPELARIYGLQGAVGIVAPSMAPGRGAYMWLRYTAHSRAIEIQGFVVLATGTIAGGFLGREYYSRPAVLVTTDYSWDGVLMDGGGTVEIDLGRLMDVRERTAAPVLRDVRPDIYEALRRLVEGGKPKSMEE